MVFLDSLGFFLGLKGYLGDFVRRWNTSMNLFLMGFRCGYCIFDLQFSLFFLRRGLFVLFRCVSLKGRVVFVSGGNSQRGLISKYNALICGEYYWAGSYKGGALSNMKHDVRNAYGISPMGGAFSLDNSNFLYFGSRVPSFIIVIDPNGCYAAFNEARLMRLPCLGLVDSSMDFCDCSYPVCMNSASFKALNSFAFVCGIVVSYSKIVERLSFICR